MRTEIATPTVSDNTTGVEGEVEAALADALPAVDLLEAVVAGRGDSATLRVTVDHPDGVNHDVCADVTRALDGAGLLERFGIEVWSPGPERPLRTDAHLHAALGRRIKVRLAEPLEGNRRNFTGTLLAADDGELNLDVDGTETSLPRSAIRRMHLVQDDGQECG